MLSLSSSNMSPILALGVVFAVGRCALDMFAEYGLCVLPTTKISIALSDQDQGLSETMDRHVYPKPQIDPDGTEQ